MTSFVFRETLKVHLLLLGNAYARIIRYDGGRIRERWKSVYQKSTNAHRVDVLEEGMKF